MYYNKRERGEGAIARARSKMTRAASIRKWEVGDAMKV